MPPDADDCVPQTEQCDGDDDDCDDVVDNGCSCSPNGSTQQCFTEDASFIGVGTCVQGTQTCSDGAWGATCVGEVTPITEICNGMDDDCDGTDDDGNPGGGACATGMSGICAAGTQTCTGGTLSGCIPNNSPGTETCDGLDNDCNTGTADGVQEAWYNQPCDGADADSCIEGSYTCSGTAQTCGDATGDSNTVADGGYEGSLSATSPYPAIFTYWPTQSSTNFGSPLCSVAACGSGPGTYGPRTGAVWNWLGGFAGAETAYVSQSLVIPTGTTNLYFYFSVPACATGGGADTFTVRIDGNTVFTTTNADAACGSTAWVQKTVNISAYANGASHTLEFRGVFVAGHTGTPTTLTNFFVDDIRLGCS